jgi:cyclic pyranopterin phosphate synthase
MAEDMTFLPRKDILSLEELREIAAAFVELGGQKIRLTGGEPLVRNGIDKLTQAIGSLPGLKELALRPTAASYIDTRRNLSAPASLQSTLALTACKQNVSEN